MLGNTIDGRAQALANCQILYGPEVEIATICSLGRFYQAIAFRFNQEDGSWVKLIHGETTNESYAAVTLLLLASECELADRFSANAISLPFEGVHRQTGILPRDGRLACWNPPEASSDTPTEGSSSFEVIEGPGGEETTSAETVVAESPSIDLTATESIPAEPVAVETHTVGFVVVETFPAEPPPVEHKEIIPDIPQKCKPMTKNKGKKAKKAEKAKMRENDGGHDASASVDVESIEAHQDVENCLPLKTLPAVGTLAVRPPSDGISCFNTDQPAEDTPPSQVIEWSPATMTEESNPPTETPGEVLPVSRTGRSSLPDRKGTTVVLKILYSNASTSRVLGTIVTLGENTKADILEAVNSYLTSKLPQDDDACGLRNIDIRRCSGGFLDADVSALEETRWTDYLSLFSQYTKFPELTVHVKDELRTSG